jgi:uncharacterized protein
MRRFMYRKLMEDLKAWKDKKNRLPLILRGARQVGKTWLLKEFGRACFDDVLYLNFEDAGKIRDIFEGSIEPQRIIEYLGALHGRKIVPEKTLLIFDEVQEIPRALTSLKYFAENTPEYAVCCAGSLLGMGLHKGTSFPVGKVDLLSLAPMSFEEFLAANNETEPADFIKEPGLDKPVQAFNEKFLDHLKKYFIIGGMPAAVSSWIEEHDFSKVEEKQRAIIDTFTQDFSKHAPHAVVPKLRYLWNSIPSQLSRENKKFIYGLVREGARAKDYEEALLWILDAGLLRKTGRISKAAVPLSAYEDLKAFKLYHLDIGLLRVMSGLSPDAITQNLKVFEEFKGALTEQFVLQEMNVMPFIRGIYYWTSGATAEVDFVISDGSGIYPVEVKSGKSLQAKSLKVFMEKYKITRAVRVSLSDLRLDGKIINIPLFLFFNLEKYIKAVKQTRGAS